MKIISSLTSFSVFWGCTAIIRSAHVKDSLLIAALPIYVIYSLFPMLFLRRHRDSIAPFSVLQCTVSLPIDDISEEAHSTPVRFRFFTVFVCFGRQGGCEKDGLLPRLSGTKNQMLSG